MDTKFLHESNNNNDINYFSVGNDHFLSVLVIVDCITYYI